MVIISPEKEERKSFYESSSSSVFLFIRVAKESNYSVFTLSGSAISAWALTAAASSSVGNIGSVNYLRVSANPS